VALPFLFIFNTDLLLINVGIGHGIVVFLVGTVAMLVFAAGTQGWFFAKNRWYDTILLLLVAFTLFRPGFWLDQISAPYDTLPPSEFSQALEQSTVGDELRLRVLGVDKVGDPVEIAVLLPVPEG